MDQLDKNIDSAHVKNKHTDDLVDHYWGSINYISNMIRASEIKAGLILSFYGIILNFMFQSVGQVTESLGDDYIFYTIAGLWFVSTAISIYFSIKCFMPRIESNYEKNIFFFGDIISAFGDINSFAKTFFDISMDEDRVFNQLGQQIYINAKIATEKFKHVNRSLKYLATGLVIFLVLILYYVIVLRLRN